MSTSTRHNAPKQISKKVIELKPMIDDNLKENLIIWLLTEDKDEFEKKYVHISKWDVSKITNMNNLFNWENYYSSNIPNYLKTYNNNNNNNNVKNKMTDLEIIHKLYNKIKNFNENLNNWNVRNVINMTNMFRGTSNFNNGNKEPLNWVLNPNVVMKNMFEDAQINIKLNLTLNRIQNVFNSNNLTIKDRNFIDDHYSNMFKNTKILIKNYPKFIFDLIGKGDITNSYLSIMGINPPSSSNVASISLTQEGGSKPKAKPKAKLKAKPKAKPKK